MNETSEAKLFIKDEHRARVLAAVKGYAASHKRGTMRKHPAVGINRQSASILARVDSAVKGFRIQAGGIHVSRPTDLTNRLPTLRVFSRVMTF